MGAVNVCVSCKQNLAHCHFRKTFSLCNLLGVSADGDKDVLYFLVLQVLCNRLGLHHVERLASQ